MIVGRRSLVTKTFAIRVGFPQARQQTLSSTRNYQRIAPLTSKLKRVKTNEPETRPLPKVNSRPISDTPLPTYLSIATKHEEHSPSHRKIVLNLIKPIPSQDLTSTRPAKIEYPEGPESDDDGNVAITARAKYLYALGRAYVTFYKTGLKNIWNNRKEYKEIKTRLGHFRGSVLRIHRLQYQPSPAGSISCT